LKSDIIIRKLFLTTGSSLEFSYI